MPLCCLHSLPGTVHSLTDSLSVVIPRAFEFVSEGVPKAYWRDVREGRVAWHADSTQAQEEIFSFEDLALTYRTWRDQGVFSFIEVRFSGEIGELEKTLLGRLKQSADWLIVDATSLESNGDGGLQVVMWSHHVALMKEIGKKVGLRLSLDRHLPPHIALPWIAKVALELGEPGFVFVEAESVEQVVFVVRGVQDILHRHALSKGSARLIPVLHSSFHKWTQTPFEVFDFPSLDALLIESGRSFFGGVAVRQERMENLFGCSLWQAVITMISQKCSSASFVEHSVDVLKKIPCDMRMPLFGSIHALSQKLAVQDQSQIATWKNALETTWSRMSQEGFEWVGEVEDIRAVVAALVDQSSEALTLLRRKTIS